MRYSIWQWQWGIWAVRGLKERYERWGSAETICIATVLTCRVGVDERLWGVDGRQTGHSWTLRLCHGRQRRRGLLQRLRSGRLRRIHRHRWRREARRCRRRCRGSSDSRLTFVLRHVVPWQTDRRQVGQRVRRRVALLDGQSDGRLQVAVEDEDDRLQKEADGRNDAHAEEQRRANVVHESLTTAVDVHRQTFLQHNVHHQSL